MSKLIAPSFIEELQSKVDIVSTINKRVPLKKSGKEMKACCPFHDEKTPSFSVTPSKQLYHCFGCGAKGNAISFLMEYEHLSFVESIETLAAENGMDVIYENINQDQVKVFNQLHQIMDHVTHYYEKNLFSNQSKTIQSYLKTRGITQNLARFFRLGYAFSQNHIEKEFPQYDLSALKDAGLVATGDNGHYDQFRNRLMFPIRNTKGQTIAFGARAIGDAMPKYLNSAETKLFQKSHNLYGLYETLTSNKKIEQIIVVEGYMDVIALFQNKITTAVASLGTAFTAGHFKVLKKHTKKIYLCFDGDHAGRKAAVRAIPNILSTIDLDDEVRIVFLPEKEDPDSFIRKNGRVAFLEKLSQGLLFSEFVYQNIIQDSDLSFVEGKAEVTNRAKLLFDQSSETDYQKILHQNFTERFNINYQLLENVEQPLAKKPSYQPTQPNSRIYYKSKTKESKLIRILLEYPVFAKKSKNTELLETITERDCRILKNLIKFIQYNQKYDLDYFISSLEAEDRQRILDIKKSVGIVDKISVSESIEERQIRFSNEFLESYELLIKKYLKKLNLST